MTRGLAEITRLGLKLGGRIETFIKDELLKRGYEPVYTPNIGRVELYQISGHYPYYADSQFNRAAQAMRQPVCVGIERGVAERAILEHHRDRVRRRHSQRAAGRIGRTCSVTPLLSLISVSSSIGYG